MHTEADRVQLSQLTAGWGPLGTPLSQASRVSVGVVYLHVEVQVYWLWICGGALCARPPLCWPQWLLAHSARVWACAPEM